MLKILVICKKQCEDPSLKLINITGDQFSQNIALKHSSIYNNMVKTEISFSIYTKIKPETWKGFGEKSIYGIQHEVGILSASS